MKFPKTVAAAAGASRSLKDLATALWEEIPTPPQNNTVDVVGKALGEVQAELAEQGYVYKVKTLGDYRNVAGWIGNGDHRSQWRDVAFSTHRRAYHAGWTPADLDAAIAKVAPKRLSERDVLAMAGKSASPSKAAAEDVVADSDTEERIEILKGIAESHPEEFTEAAKDNPAVRSAARDAFIETTPEMPLESTRDRLDVASLIIDLKMAVRHALNRGDELLHAIEHQPKPRPTLMGDAVTEASNTCVEGGERLVMLGEFLATSFEADEFDTALTNLLETGG
jgi:hypothetical protein